MADQNPTNVVVDSNVAVRLSNDKGVIRPTLVDGVLHLPKTGAAGTKPAVAKTAQPAKPIGVGSVILRPSTGLFMDVLDQEAASRIVRGDGLSQPRSLRRNLGQKSLRAGRKPR